MTMQVRTACQAKASPLRLLLGHSVVHLVLTALVCAWPRIAPKCQMLLSYILSRKLSLPEEGARDRAQECCMHPKHNTGTMREQ